MPTDAVLLVNPSSGKGRGAEVGRDVERRLRAAGLTVRSVAGRDGDDAVEVARRAVAERPGMLVAVGGDGIVHFAVQALAGTDVPLGIVAGGTGNDIARALGVPLDTAGATANLVAGTPRTIDLGRIGPPGGEDGGGRWFGGVLYAGFDSAVNERTNAIRWPRGRLRYNLSILLELAAFTPKPFTVELDGDVRRFEGMFVSVGNTESYGGGLRICVGAVPDDGLFQVTLIERVSRAAIPGLMPKLKRGTHVEHPAIHQVAARSVRIHTEGVTAYADGERVGPLPVTAEVVPGALRVITPA